LDSVQELVVAIFFRRDLCVCEAAVGEVVWAVGDGGWLDDAVWAVVDDGVFGGGDDAEEVGGDVRRWWSTRVMAFGQW